MSSPPPNLQHSTDDTLALCERLTAAASELDQRGIWPEQQLTWCAQAGVFRWFIPPEFGGWGWSDEQILEGYLALSQSCMTTTFVLTQWHAACRRLLASPNVELKNRLLPAMAAGELFATVGISHLTTSRQHVGSPVLKAAEIDNHSFLLDGFSPLGHRSRAADVIVLGATLADGRQVLAAVPTDRLGVTPRSGLKLMALTGSCTDQVDVEQVRVDTGEVLEGPCENVLQASTSGGAGGLQTSALAVGLSLGAVEFLKNQAAKRAELQPIADKLEADVRQLRRTLFELTGGLETMTPSLLRQQANSLVLRSTQAALQAAKGAGFIATHPAGRWAREAMFFLVWSCPQPVAHANLCELAQLG